MLGYCTGLCSEASALLLRHHGSSDWLMLTAEHDCKCVHEVQRRVFMRSAGGNAWHLAAAGMAVFGVDLVGFGVGLVCDFG